MDETSLQKIVFGQFRHDLYEWADRLSEHDRLLVLPIIDEYVETYCLIELSICESIKTLNRRYPHQSDGITYKFMDKKLTELNSKKRRLLKHIFNILNIEYIPVSFFAEIY